MKLIVFSDLDGTLLDHHSYDYTPALPALDRIRREGWPLVFVTSKTRAEVEALRRELQVDDPFIVENGGGVFFPEPSRHLAPPEAVEDGGALRLTLGLDYEEIRAFVRERGEALGMHGFGDMTLLEIQEITGLAPDAAARAKERDFTEPFRLEPGHTIEAVDEAAAHRGMKTTTGGRLHHLMGADQDKGRAVGLVQGLYEGRWGHEAVTIGLGDGPNDLPMLAAVAHPVVIPAPGRAPLPLSHPRGRVAPAQGPEGWRRALLEIVEELESA